MYHNTACNNSSPVGYKVSPFDLNNVLFQSCRARRTMPILMGYNCETMSEGI